MPSYSFDHIHLFSHDPTKTAEFYEKVFNAKRLGITELPSGRKIIKLDLNGVTMLISKSKDEKAPTGLLHFGIRTDDLSKTVAKLKAKGVNFSQDVTEVMPGLKVSFLQATDGAEVELQEGSV